MVRETVGTLGRRLAQLAVVTASAATLAPAAALTDPQFCGQVCEMDDGFEADGTARRGDMSESGVRRILFCAHRTLRTRQHAKLNGRPVDLSMSLTRCDRHNFA